MTSMANLRALIAAAGRGSRSGLPFPKTLFPIKGKPILVRILELLAPYDDAPTLIVSPDGLVEICKSLALHGLRAELVIQPEPRGMGDAVMRFAQAPAAEEAEHVLLVWGDVPFIQPETIAALVAAHEAQCNDFTFATRHVDSAYTVVSRDSSGQVMSVFETREAGMKAVPGERDIGLFVFRKAIVLEMLQEELPGKWGMYTQEHGFLYLIQHLVSRGLRVAALPIATELDLVSLNCMKDIDAYL